MNRFACLITCVWVLVLAGCGGGGSAPSPAVVYAAGWAYENEMVHAPVYWMGEAPNVLSRVDPMCNGRAYGIALAGGDVHVVGYTSQCTGVASGTEVISAAWWRNGQRTDLPKPNEFNSVALDIATAGASIYIAGAVSSIDGTRPVPVYWKDGLPVALNLPVDANSGVAQGIAVSGQDVYVSALFRGANAFFVGYYRNGALTRLPLPQGRPPNAGPFRIAVDGMDIYVSGSLQVPVGPGVGGPRGLAVYWKNGTLVPLRPDDDSFVDTLGLALDGGRVYVAGWRQSPALRNFRVSPILWTDATEAILALRNPDLDEGVASAVEVSSGTVSVAGYTFDRSVTPNSNRFGTACYWLDGVRNDLKGLSYAGPPAAHDPWIVGFWPDFAAGLASPISSGPAGEIPVNLFTRTPEANSVAWAIAIKP